MDKVIVTFHRTYEIQSSQIIERLQVKGYNVSKYINNKVIVQEIAEEIARDYLADEMPEFVDNTQDFVSATTEII